MIVTGSAVAVTLVIGTSPVAGVAAQTVTYGTDLAVATENAPAEAVHSPPGPEPAAPAGAPAPPAVEPTPVATGAPLVVGDSIALGSAAALRSALGGTTTVDAKVGRQFAAGPAIVAHWAQSHDGPVVVALGANGTVSRGDLEAVVSATGSRRVVLVGVAVARRWRDGNNAALREAAAHHPQVAFVDWAALVASHPGILGPDGVHPGPRGRALLARAVADAIGR